MGKKWLGSTPEKCDICENKFKDVFYDAVIPKFGVWGLICQNCFDRYQCRIGTGYGQKYSASTPYNKIE